MGTLPMSRTDVLQWRNFDSGDAGVLGRASVKTLSSPRLHSLMEIVAALLLAFGLAAYLRFRRWPALRAIVLASLLSPATITFGAYVFPAEPEFRMWWHITVVTSVLFGLCAAAAGYLLVVFMHRHGA